MEIPLNPFVVSSTVKAAPFFGRQDIVVWLITELENSDPHAVLLYGPRGIGKTALLHHLQTVLASEDRYVPVYYGLVDVFHRIQNLRMTHQFIGPGKQQMNFMPPFALDRAAGGCFEGFQTIAVMACLCAGHNTNRKIKAVALELFDRVLRE
jgi:energy-coupling factor transporter ATP-binding protein EcfA2